MHDQDERAHAYNVKRGVHVATVDPIKYGQENCDGIRFGIPRHHLDDSHWLVQDGPFRLVSARYKDLRTGSELLYSEGTLVFVPGHAFKLSEELYVHFLAAREANEATAVS